MQGDSAFETAPEIFMQSALELADAAAAIGEVPVGAVVVLDNKIIGRGHNQQITHKDPSAHAEVVALRDAAKHLGNYRLTGATLFSTIEPCTMCLGACVHARVARIVFGAPEPRAGAIALLNAQEGSARRFNHIPEVSEGCLREECSARLVDFFRARRHSDQRPNGDTTSES